MFANICSKVLRTLSGLDGQRKLGVDAVSRSGALLGCHCNGLCGVLALLIEVEDGWWSDGCSSFALKILCRIRGSDRLVGARTIHEPPANVSAAPPARLRCLHNTMRVYRRFGVYVSVWHDSLDL